jgi:ribosomal protein S27E
MACPTCEHPLSAISVSHGTQTFLCDRCGTVVVHEPGGEAPTVYVPKLVERCREFELRIIPDLFLAAMTAWKNLGIAEAINKPKVRP